MFHDGVAWPARNCSTWRFEMSTETSESYCWGSKRIQLSNQLRLILFLSHYSRGFVHSNGGWPWDFWTINSIKEITNFFGCFCFQTFAPFQTLGIQWPSENGFMEPKYFAFRRWLYTQSSSDVRSLGKWIHNELKHIPPLRSGLSSLNSNLPHLVGFCSLAWNWSTPEHKRISAEKWMLGRRFAFGNGPFFQMTFVHFRGGKWMELILTTLWFGRFWCSK